MGFYLKIEDVDEAPLASVKGWGDVRRWVKGLSVEDFEPFIAFVEWGKSFDPEAVEGNIRELLADDPPENAETVKTLQGLLLMLENRPESATFILVTDGMVEDS